MYEYHAIVERVVDGDTIDLHIDLGFDVWIRQRVRLLGIDTPESRTRNAREKRFGKMASARVEELLPNGSKHVITTQFDSRGKFGRAMVDVLLQDGDTLCSLLVRERLAVPYHGQSKSKIKALHEANWRVLEGKSPVRSNTE